MIGGLRVFAAKLRALFGSAEPDWVFDDEMQMHLRLLAERYVRDGMTPADAASAARRQFGNTTLLQEHRREMRTIPSLETFWRDLRFGARQLRLNPLFTTIAVLSLSLGIGANTAVFTLLDQLVLRLLPVADPARLVMMWATGPHLGENEGNRMSSYPMYQDFQRKAVAFESVFCRLYLPLAVTIDGSTEPVDAELVSGNYFQALRVRSTIGRVFSPEADDRIYKGHPVVILSHRYWMNRFAGDPNVVGKKILVNNYPMVVVGVSAAGFAGIDPSRSPHIWAPIQMAPVLTPEDNMRNRRVQWIQMFARLRPGYTVDSARASLQPLFHQILEQELHEPDLRGVSKYDRARFLKRSELVETAANGYSEMRQQYSTALVVLMAMAVLILLIACSNVAGLLIARAVARQKEMAVRLAIGAGRKTLIRQLLVESALLSLAGAALGIVLAGVATRGLLNMLPSNGALLMLRAEPDSRILLFSVGMALATGLLFGLAPALQATKLDLLHTLKDIAGSVTGGGSARLRKSLVTAQVALSFLLLVGAALFSKTLINLKSAPNGFENMENMVTFEVDLAKNGYSIPRLKAAYEDIRRKILAKPGVTEAAYAGVPLLRGFMNDTLISVEGHRAKDGEDMQAYFNGMSPGYWKTMGVRILQGRDFDESDRFDAPAGEKDQEVGFTAVIVNRQFSAHFFGKESAIGRHLGTGGSGKKLPMRIIGVVENSQYGGPRDGVLRQVFVPCLQANYPLTAYFYVRTAAKPSLMFPILRGIVAKLDGSVPVLNMKTLDTQLDETLSTERLIATLSTVFGLLATILSALGLYGVMAFVVARRTKEIGLRMALGAPRGSVLWLILREVLILLAAGLGAGIPCAYFLSRYVSSQLFGVKPTDLWSCVAAAAILGLVAAVSGFVPARRASAIDPISALRYE